MLRILFLGEIIGIPTVKEIEKKLNEIIEENKIDFTIANGDGASNGYGILKKSAYALYNGGINAVTCGDYVFNKKDAIELLKAPFLLRPYNLTNSLGGKGSSLFKINENIKIGIINLLGRANFNKILSTDPFFSVNKAIEKLNEETNIIIVDFHGGTTSEIQAMQWHLAGRVSLVVGSHLRVLTADNRIIKDKTAVVTGIGYCGGYWSIHGLLPEIEINKIKNGQFEYSKVVKDFICLQGVLVEIDEESGNAKSIELFKEKIS